MNYGTLLKKEEKMRSYLDLTEKRLDNNSGQIINHIIFKAKAQSGYKFGFTIIKHPTANCQVSCISNAQLLNKFRMTSTARIRYLMYFIKKHTTNQVLVDLNIHNVEKFKKIMSKYSSIVYETPYKSTNGSNMVMILFKFNRNLTDDILETVK